MVHLLTVHGADSKSVSFETDRALFLGRGNDVADPDAMRRPARCPAAQGSVLDPIVAIRHRIELESEQSVSIDMVTGAADSREVCIALAEKYQDWRLADRVFDLAWTHSQVVLRQINISEADAQLYGRLAGNVIYGNASLRASADLVARNHRGQSGLWGYAISGDLPIVLLLIRDLGKIDLVRQLVQAHAYWRLKGLAVDLVIWNEDRGGYRQILHDQIMGLIAAGCGSEPDRSARRHFRACCRTDSSEDRVLLQSVARAIVLSDNHGTLAEQVKRRDPAESPHADVCASTARADATPQRHGTLRRRELISSMASAASAATDANT